MTAMKPAELTEQVLAAYAGVPDPRLRELIAALIRHLHGFVTETGLTPEEWLATVEFLTATGQKCDDRRQEFVLLSDVLGLSSLVDIVNAADGATESTVLGPFYVSGAPARAMGEQIGRPEDGSPTFVRGRVTDPGGRPLDRARLDVWQTAATACTTPRTRASPRSTCAGCSSPGRTAGTSSGRCGRSATRSPPTARSASCCAARAGTTGGRRTSTRSSPRPAAGR